MATAHVDRIDTLSAQERNGVIVRLVRRARVTGLTNNDYRALFSALEAAGIPAVGSSPTGAPNLQLVDRNPTIVEGEPSSVDVDLVYEHAAGKNQALGTPHYGTITYQVRAAVNQVESNTDVDGNPVTVSHTYPPEDPDFAGQTKVQGGQFQFFQPQTCLTVRGIFTTRYPWLMERYLIGGINETDWAGRGPGEWMCTGFSWTPLDGQSSKYEVEIEFQHNPGGWNPTVIFTDERTNRPPTGLVPGTGYKTVEKHRPVNFESVIGTRVQGG
jgi:hypothetical protein